ncbi:MAG TPA: Gfo/Idh/MocA family oxidoreductase [Gemmatimonadaceae bacterium]|jgi:xylose dehydrogenase (NAD/NADP)|nr:Gfo/Idh/MocA family oxidoreductase [Gemmatimonadaceae bacterium]
MRWGLLSTARINDRIIAAAGESDRATIVAVGSRDAARAADYARAKGIPRAHGTYEALLDDPGVDAVYISLPNGLHHAWSVKALAAGKHVLCEKPYSRRPVDVEEAYALAAAGGRILMEAFMYRHHPQIQRVVDLVRGGAIGRLRAVTSTFTFLLRNPGDARLRPELDGGALMDVGCYCVNGTRALAGEPEHVLGEQVTGPGGVDMGFFGTMRHAGDVVSQFETSFTAPKRQRLHAVGEDGVLTVDAPWRADWGGTVTITRGEAVEIVPIPPANPYRLELDNMADAVAGVAPPLLGYADAIGQARTLEALYVSAATLTAEPVWPQTRAVDRSSAPRGSP